MKKDYSQDSRVLGYCAAYEAAHGRTPSLSFPGGGWVRINEFPVRITVLPEMAGNLWRMKNEKSKPPHFQGCRYIPGNVYEFETGDIKGAFRIATIRIDPVPRTSVVVVLAGISPRPRDKGECGKFFFEVADFEKTINELDAFWLMVAPVRRTCAFVKDWCGTCGKQAAIPDAPYCVDHIGIKCAVCGDQATHNIAWSSLEVAGKRGEYFCEKHIDSHKLPIKKG